MKDLYKILWLIALIVFSCSKDDTPPTEPPVTEIKEGFNITPAEPDADNSLTIIFKAPKTSALYGYNGDVYIYTGIVSEGQWLYVPAAWEQNLEKCKMAVVEPNVWSITLSPSIRQWFGSGETPVTKIGIVIRSADGTKKGLENDFFITVTDTRYHPFEPADIKYAPLPDNVMEGINIIDNSTITLVLYDKDKEGNHKDFAHAIGDFNNWTLSNDEQSQMYRDENTNCWWITLTGLETDKEYAFQYYVGTKNGERIRLADAYARKVLDPDNDPYIPASTYPENKTYPEKGAIGIVSVFKIQEDAYNWEIDDFQQPERDNLVIYEMLLRDFTTSSDINGALQKLDSLQSLGVNAIELMPVQEFDGNDSWGYNPCFYFAMDKAYGTDHMYKQFIDECHKRGMAVILDVVYNHATGNNSFAKMWWDSANNRPAANNPYFNVTAPHPYSVFNDFNHESPPVRKFVKRNLQFLLEEYKVDGFRFDLTKGFTQNKNGSPNIDNSAKDDSRIAILKDYHAAIKTVKPEAFVILEHFCEDREEIELSNDGMMVWQNMNGYYCQSAMGWPENSDFSGTYYGTASRPANSLVSYMESHDEERAAYKQIQWGNGILKTDLTARMSQLSVNAAFFFTVPGPKMIWQFEEMGYDISIEENGRTGRKPIKWDYLDVPQRKQLHDTYAKLIALRMDEPEMFSSTATLQWKVTDTDWKNGRFLTLSNANGTKQVVVIGNFTNTAISATTSFPKTGMWYNYMDSSETLEVTSITMSVNVPANNFKIFSTFQP
ncbi:MAG: alpha-amylase family glycosyl hydrolase [Dysgonamonadaceae bacterium]|nr:alpha-amylase family glycosyl hydrolase [Dysgonamonadaceae bacterium]